MSEDAIDIRRSVRTICKKLGVKPENVGRIDLQPHMATVVEYLTNETGHKYVVLDKDDPQYGVPATLKHEFDIRT